MSFLDSIKEKVMGGNQSDQAMKIINQLITESGGLDGLVDRFEVAGFGDRIESWLSAGPNRPISGEQILKIFGVKQLQSLATRFGLEPHEVANHLATQLPKVVDKLSPEGKIPSFNQYKEKMSQWRHLFH